MPGISRRSFIGRVTESEDDERAKLCPYCSEHFQRSIKLKEKTTAELDLEGLSEGELERIQLEADRWRQCPLCLSKWKIRDVPREDKEVDLPWDTDLESDSTKSVESVFGRDRLKTKGRLARLRQENILSKLPKDPEVIHALRSGKRVENYNEILPE